MADKLAGEGVLVMRSTLAVGLWDSCKQRNGAPGRARLWQPRLALEAFVGSWLGVEVR